MDWPPSSSKNKEKCSLSHPFNTTNVQITLYDTKQRPQEAMNYVLLAYYSAKVILHNISMIILY